MHPWKVTFFLDWAFVRNDETREGDLGQFALVCLMNWKHTLFIGNVPTGFLELDVSLSCGFRNCKFTKWWFTILSMGLKNVPKTGTGGFGTIIVCLTGETEIICLFSSFSCCYGMILSLTPSFEGARVSLTFFTLPFLVEKYSTWHSFFWGNIFLEEPCVSKVWLELGKWFISPFTFLSSSWQCLRHWCKVDAITSC